MGIIAVLISLTIMIILIRKGCKLSFCIWSALPIMAFLSGLSLEEIGQSLATTVTSSVSHNLLLAILGIGVLGEILYYNGSIDGALDAMKKIIKEPRLIITASPAFIGLMPIPGGAYLSAPLVKEIGDDINLSSEKMSLANVFYRHIFYFFFPLYPSLIFFLEVTEVPLYYLLLFSVLPFLIAFAQSFRTVFAGLDSINNHNINTTGTTWSYLLLFLYNVSPILVALIIPLSMGWPYYTGLAVAVILATVQRINRFSGTELIKRGKILISGIKVNILITIAGILVFKDLVVFSEALNPLAVLLKEYGFPIILIALIIPYLSGVVTGNQIAALGVSLPLLLPLLPGGEAEWPMLSLAYLSSLMGYMVSPLHLCPVLTADFFKVHLHVVLYRLQLMSIGVLVSSTVIAWAIGLF